MSSKSQARNIGTIIGANIRRARDEHRLTQRELALWLGGKIDGQRISDWERGAYRPNDTSMLRLTEVLGHDFAWFFVNHDDESVVA